MESLPSKVATIADVAARAGVGVATVSRVLNAHTNVRPATREACSTRSRRSDYRPSPLARNLSLRRTHVIGVVVPFFTEPVRGRTRARRCRRLARSPYDLMLFDIESEDRRDHAFQLFDRGDRSDGLLMVSLIPPDAEVDRLRAAGCRACSSTPRTRRCPASSIDDVRRRARDGAPDRARTPANRASSATSRPIRSASPRAATARAATSARSGTRGIELRPEYVREGTQSHHIARSIAIDLLRLPSAPTAVFAASDTQALGVLEAARILASACRTSSRSSASTTSTSPRTSG